MCQSWRRTICDGPVLGSAMLREASWSRSNFSWGTFRCKRPNATLGANSGFDQPSMIALASSRILELGARLWKGCRQYSQSLVLRFRQTRFWLGRHFSGIAGHSVGVRNRNRRDGRWCVEQFQVSEWQGRMQAYSPGQWEIHSRQPGRGSVAMCGAGKVSASARLRRVGSLRS